jgi:hypothetical protein
MSIATQHQRYIRKQNRKVYTFIKHPDFDLEPLAQGILNTIEKHSPINREDLLVKLSEVLETRNTVSAVLSYHQRFLVRFGCIGITEP